MRGTLALAVLVAACGNSSHGPDASVMTAKKHLADVEVEVYTNVSNTPPVPNAPVAFVDPDGNGQVIMTGADGIARGQVVVGGSITALVPLVPADNPPSLFTVLDVQDGDHLQVGMVPPLADNPSPGGTPTCSTDTLAVTYTNVDPTRIAQLGVQRKTDADPTGTYVDLPVAATTQTTLSGSGATRAFIETHLESAPLPQAMPSVQVVRDTIDGCATSYSLDVGRNLLPWIGVPTLDADAGVLHIPMDGPGGGDLMEVRASLQRGGMNINWDITGPHAGDLYFPPLPDPLADYDPKSGDALYSSSALLIDADEVHGYDQARTHAPAIERWLDFSRTTMVERVRASYRTDLH